MLRAPKLTLSRWFLYRWKVGADTEPEAVHFEVSAAEPHASVRYGLRACIASTEDEAVINWQVEHWPFLQTSKVSAYPLLLSNSALYSVSLCLLNGNVRPLRYLPLLPRPPLAPHATLPPVPAQIFRCSATHLFLHLLYIIPNLLRLICIRGRGKDFVTTGQTRVQSMVH